MADSSKTMKCPLCGSDDVKCDENKTHHVHICNACGHKDVFKDDTMRKAKNRG